MLRLGGSLANWLLLELKCIWRLIGYWPLYPALAACALFLFASYQVRNTYFVDIGGIFDGPYARDFHAVERSTQLDFRWSKADSRLSFPGVGQDDYAIDLQIIGYRPAPPQPRLRFEVNGRAVGVHRSSGVPETVALDLSREDVEGGDLDLIITSETFAPEGDPRHLGVVVDGVTLRPDGDGPVIPAAGQMYLLMAAAAAGGLIGVRVGMSRAQAVVLILASGLAFALLIAFARLWLTVFSSQLLTTLALAYAAVVIMSLVAGAWYKRAALSVHPGVMGALLGLFALLFVVKLGGQLHPQAFVMDAMFHVHRLEQVLSGDLYFTIVSGEWGGHRTFYLPTVYLFMAPVSFLMEDKVLLVKSFTVFLDCTSIFLVFYLVTRTTGDQRAAVLAAAIFGLLPLSFLVFSWGVTSNLFGQWLALALLTLVATSFDKLHSLAMFALLGFGLLLAMLSHPGVVLLTAAALAFFVLLTILARRRPRLERGHVALLVAGCLAAAVAFGGYYSRFTGTMAGEAAALAEERQQTAEQGGQDRVFYVGGSVADRSLGLLPAEVHSLRELALEGARGLYREARAYYRVWPLAGLLLGLGLLVAGHNRSLLPWLLGAWVLSAVVFAGAGFLTGLYVRYMLFLLPVAAVGSGIFLSRILARQQAGRVVTLLMLGYLVWSGVSLWYERVMYAFH